MLVPELYVSHLAFQPQAGAAGVRAWTAGQIMEATVVRQALDGTVTLRIGGQEVQARTGLTLAADQPITLQVAQSGVQTVLRVLHATNASVAPDPGTARTGGPPPELATLTQAWRQVLPREGNAQPLLARLGTLLLPPASGGGATAAPSALPAPVAGALQALSARLPALEALFTATGLKRAIGDSGVFLEARLGQAAARGEPPAVAGDFKANLLALVQTLRTAAATPAATGAATAEVMAAARGSEPPVTPALATIFKEADAALARVEQQQLANLGRPADQPPLWLIEIPLRDGARHGLLRLQIEADESNPAPEGGEAPWSVVLDFDLAPLGALHARVGVRGDNVSAALWAEEPATAALVNRHLDELGAALHAAGLSPTALSCQAGTPPSRAAAAEPGTSLVDERA